MKALIAVVVTTLAASPSLAQDLALPDDLSCQAYLMMDARKQRQEFVNMMATMLANGSARLPEGEALDSDAMQAEFARICARKPDIMAGNAMMQLAGQ